MFKLFNQEKINVILAIGHPKKLTLNITHQ